jgi:hypothetical protein
MEENIVPTRVLYMNLETRLRGIPRNRWQVEVREDGRIVGAEEWKEKVYNREELEEAPENGKELLHSAHGNGMNELMNKIQSVNHSEHLQNLCYIPKDPGNFIPILCHWVASDANLRT